MSNWKICIPSNPKYENASNSFWVTNVSVVPHEGVSIKVQVQYQNGALANEFVNINGDEYKEWSSDDDYIKNYICDKEGYLGRPCDVTEKPNIPISQDDNRSVHNEADIQRIQTLQEQLDAQALKLKSITDMLIGKGFV